MCEAGLEDQREAEDLEAEPERDRRRQQRCRAEREQRVPEPLRARDDNEADGAPQCALESQRDEREAVVVEDGEEEVGRRDEHDDDAYDSEQAQLSTRRNINSSR